MYYSGGDTKVCFRPLLFPLDSYCILDIHRISFSLPEDVRCSFRLSLFAVDVGVSCMATVLCSMSVLMIIVMDWCFLMA